jgi:hypothetical protein
VTTHLRNRRDLHADQPLETLPHPSADLMIRSRSMLLIHENLAKARIAQRLDEAQLVRQSRLAQAARLRSARSSRVASAASRARLLVAFGGASR